MSKRLVVTLDDDVYAGLQRVIGQRRISRFLNDLVRPYVIGPSPVHSPRPGAAAQDASPAETDVEWVERGVCP